MQPISASELILTQAGRIYHLDLLPDELASTVITVGDPGRVAMVSRYFDRIEFQRQHREFVVHTGEIGKRRLSVISTGMGTPNIDIVINELDALVNIDFNTRTVKPNTTSLDIVRIGTAGCLQADIPVGEIALTHMAVGLDNLMAFYNCPETTETQALLKDLKHVLPICPYVVAGASALMTQVNQAAHQGITVTCPGFYAPQSRTLRVQSRYNNLLDILSDYQYNNIRPINFEMETAAIYGLASTLGHNACSISVLLANRQTGDFIKDIDSAIDKLIQQTLEQLTTSQ